MWYFEYCEEESHVSKNTNGIFWWVTSIYKEISYIHVDRYSKYRDEENPHTQWHFVGVHGSRVVAPTGSSSIAATTTDHDAFMPRRLLSYMVESQVGSSKIALTRDPGQVDGMRGISGQTRTLRHWFQRMKHWTASLLPRFWNLVTRGKRLRTSIFHPNNTHAFCALKGNFCFTVHCWKSKPEL